MTAGITRRDFINGIAIAVAGAAAVDLSRAQAAPPFYPPDQAHRAVAELTGS
jgi:hypothetical protein